MYKFQDKVYSEDQLNKIAEVKGYSLEELMGKNPEITLVEEEEGDDKDDKKKKKEKKAKVGKPSGPVVAEKTQPTGPQNTVLDSENSSLDSFKITDIKPSETFIKESEDQKEKELELQKKLNLMSLPNYSKDDSGNVNIFTPPTGWSMPMNKQDNFFEGIDMNGIITPYDEQGPDYFKRGNQIYNEDYEEGRGQPGFMEQDRIRIQKEGYTGQVNNLESQYEFEQGLLYSKIHSKGSAVQVPIENAIYKALSEGGQTIAGNRLADITLYPHTNHEKFAFADVVMKTLAANTGDDVFYSKSGSAEGVTQEDAPSFFYTSATVVPTFIYDPRDSEADEVYKKALKMLDNWNITLPDLQNRKSQAVEKDLYKDDLIKYGDTYSVNKFIEKEGSYYLSGDEKIIASLEDQRATMQAEISNLSNSPEKALEAQKELDRIEERLTELKGEGVRQLYDPATGSFVDATKASEEAKTLDEKTFEDAEEIVANNDYEAIVAWRRNSYYKLRSLMKEASSADLKGEMSLVEDIEQLIVDVGKFGGFSDITGGTGPGDVIERVQKRGAKGEEVGYIPGKIPGSHVLSSQVEEALEQFITLNKAVELNINPLTQEKDNLGVEFIDEVYYNIFGERVSSRTGSGNYFPLGNREQKQHFANAFAMNNYNLNSTQLEVLDKSITEMATLDVLPPLVPLISTIVIAKKTPTWSATTKYIDKIGNLLKGGGKSRLWNNTVDILWGSGVSTTGGQSALKETLLLSGAEKINAELYGSEQGNVLMGTSLGANNAALSKMSNKILLGRIPLVSPLLRQIERAESRLSKGVGLVTKPIVGGGTATGTMIVSEAVVLEIESLKENGKFAEAAELEKLTETEHVLSTFFAMTAMQMSSGTYRNVKDLLSKDIQKMPLETPEVKSALDLLGLELESKDGKKGVNDMSSAELDATIESLFIEKNGTDPSFINKSIEGPIQFDPYRAEKTKYVEARNVLNTYKDIKFAKVQADNYLSEKNVLERNKILDEVDLIARKMKAGIDLTNKENDFLANLPDQGWNSGVLLGEAIGGKSYKDNTQMVNDINKRIENAQQNQRIVNDYGYEPGSAKAEKLTTDLNNLNAIQNNLNTAKNKLKTADGSTRMILENEIESNKLQYDQKVEEIKADNLKHDKVIEKRLLEAAEEVVAMNTGAELIMPSTVDEFQKMHEAENPESNKDVRKMDAFISGNKLIINKARAIETRAITAPKHELFHYLFRNSYKEPATIVNEKGETIKNPEAGKMTKEGLKLVEDFKNSLSESQRRLINERIDNNYRYEKNDKGEFIRDEQGNRIERPENEYAEEVFTAAIDLRGSNKIKKKQLEKIVDYIRPTFPNLKIGSGQEVIEMIKTLDKPTSRNKKAIEQFDAKQGEVGQDVKYSENVTNTEALDLYREKKSLIEANQQLIKEKAPNYLDKAKENSIKIAEINKKMEDKGAQVNLVYELNKDVFLGKPLKEYSPTELENLSKVLAKTRIDKTDSQGNPIYKTDVKTNKPGNVVDKETMPGLGDLYTEYATKIAQKYKNLPDYNEADFVQTLLYGDIGNKKSRGLLSILSIFKGGENNSLNAFVNRHLKERAKEIAAELDTEAGFKGELDVNMKAKDQNMFTKEDTSPKQVASTVLKNVDTDGKIRSSIIDLAKDIEVSKEALNKEIKQKSDPFLTDLRSTVKSDKVVKQVKNSLGTRKQYEDNLNKVYEDVKKIITNDVSVAVDAKWFPFYEVGGTAKVSDARTAGSKIKNEKAGNNINIPVDFTKENFVDYMLGKGEWAFKHDSKGNIIYKDGMPQEISAGTPGNRKDRLALMIAEQAIRDALPQVKSEQLTNKSNELEKILDEIKKQDQDLRGVNYKDPKLIELAKERKNIVDELMTNNVEQVVASLADKLKVNPNTKFSETKIKDLEEILNDFRKSDTKDIVTLESIVNSKGNLSDDEKGIIVSDLNKKYNSILEKGSTGDIAQAKEVKKQELIEKYGEEEGKKLFEELDKIEISQGKNWNDTTKDLNTEFKDMLPKDTDGNSIPFETPTGKNGLQQVMQDPVRKASYDKTQTSILNRLEPSLINSGVLTTSMGYNSLKVPVKGKGGKVEMKNLSKSLKLNKETGIWETTKEKRTESQLINDLLDGEIKGTVNEQVAKDIAGSNIIDPGRVKKEVNDWMESKGLKEGETLSPELRSELRDFVRKRVAGKEGDLEGVMAANKNLRDHYYVDGVYAELQAAYEKGPNALKEAVDNVNKQFQIQTNISKGIIKGTATVKDVSIKRGDQSIEKNISGLHSEHYLQLQKFHDTFIKQALKNIDNPAEFKKVYEELSTEFEQGLVAKEYQMRYDSKAEGGPAMYSGPTPLTLGTSNFQGGTYLDGKGLNVGNSMLDLTTGKTITEKIVEAGFTGEVDMYTKNFQEVLKDIENYEFGSKTLDNPTIEVGLNNLAGQGLDAMNGKGDPYKVGILAEQVKRQMENMDATNRVQDRNIEVSGSIPYSGNKFSSNVNPLELSTQKSLQEIQLEDALNKMGNELNKKPAEVIMFDADGVLLNDPDAKVKATMPNGKVIELDGVQYAKRGEKLAAKGAEFNFDMFDGITDGAVPAKMLPVLKRMVDSYKEELARTEGDPKKVKLFTVLTARTMKAKEPILRFLDENGITNVEFIGVGSSDPNAKVAAAKELFATGKANSMYFADDHLPNSEAMKDFFDTYDIKGRSQHIKYSATMDKTFNEILEASTGIKAHKEFSAAKASRRGKGKNKMNPFLSNGDFEYLMDVTLPKGKAGDDARYFYNETLYRPYQVAEMNLEMDRASLASDYKGLQKQMPNIRKNFNKEAVEDYSYEDAIRILAWDMQGIEIPGLSATDLKDIRNFGKENLEVSAYAQSLIDMNKGDGYTMPGDNWMSGNIQGDLMRGLMTTKRSKYLKTWSDNKNVLFSEANMNKLEAAYGKPFVENLKGSLEAQERGSNIDLFSGGKGMRRFNKLINNSTGATLFWNPKSVVGQMSSIFNSVDAPLSKVMVDGEMIPADNTPLKASKVFFENPKTTAEFWAEGWNALGYRRAHGIDEWQKQIGENNLGKFSQRLKQIGFTPSSYADSFSANMALVPMWMNRTKTYANKTNPLTGEKYTYKEAKSRALQDSLFRVEKTQQSSNPFRTSTQGRNTLNRAIMSFTTTQRAYLQKQIQAGKDIVNGRGSLMGNLGTIIYYGGINNFMFSAFQNVLMANMFDDQNDFTEGKRVDNTINGMADGLLRGFGWQGATISTLKNIGLELYDRSQRKRPEYGDAAWRVLDMVPGVDIRVSKLRQAAYPFDSKKGRLKMYNEGFSLNNPAFMSGANIIEGLTSFPASRGLKLWEGMAKGSQADLEMWKRVHYFMGFHEGQIEEKKPYKLKTKPATIGNTQFGGNNNFGGGFGTNKGNNFGGGF